VFRKLKHTAAAAFTVVAVVLQFEMTTASAALEKWTGIKTRFLAKAIEVV
jgi:hypothetical protein